MFYNHHRPANVIAAQSASNWERSLRRRTTSSSPPTRYATPTTTRHPEPLDVRHIRRPGEPRPGNCSSGTCRSSGSLLGPSQVGAGQTGQAGRSRTAGQGRPVKDGPSTIRSALTTSSALLAATLIVLCLFTSSRRSLGDNDGTSRVPANDGSCGATTVRRARLACGRRLRWATSGSARVDRGTNRIAALDVAL